MSIPALQFSVLDVTSCLLWCAGTGFHSPSVMMLAGPVKLVADDIFRLMVDVDEGGVSEHVPIPFGQRR